MAIIKSNQAAQRPPLTTRTSFLMYIVVAFSSKTAKRDNTPRQVEAKMGRRGGYRQKNKPAIQTYGTGFLINPYENQLLLLVIAVN